MYRPPLGPFFQSGQCLSLSSHQVPHQCESESRSLVPRKNFPTGKKVIFEWRDASRNPKIWKRLTREAPFPLIYKETRQALDQRQETPL